MPGPISRGAALARAGGFVVLPLLLASRESPRTHVIRLDNNRFTPSEIRAHAGDTLRFVNGNGGPHNVRFEPDSIGAPARGLLDEAMPNKIAPLSGPLLLDRGESYTVVLPGVAAGRYPIVCLPHFASMRGAVTVEP